MPDPQTSSILVQLLRGGAPPPGADPAMAALVAALKGGTAGAAEGPALTLSDSDRAALVARLRADGSLAMPASPAPDPASNPFAALGAIQPPPKDPGPNSALIAALRQPSGPPPFQTPPIEDDTRPVTGSGDDEAPSADQAASDAAQNSRPSNWDPIVEREVAKFNRMNGADPGDDIYLDPDLIKAQIMTETLGHPGLYRSDPMHVNGPFDWADEKTGIGLTKGQSPGPDLSIRAGLQWLDRKADLHDDKGRPGPFIGWQRTLQRYNVGDPDYWKKTQAYYNWIKSGSQGPIPTF